MDKRRLNKTWDVKKLENNGKVKLGIIEAYDHFSTNDDTDKFVIVRIAGEFIEENEHYIVLKSFNRDLSERTKDDLHNILKVAIIKKKIVEIDFNEV